MGIYEDIKGFLIQASRLQYIIETLNNDVREMTKEIKDLDRRMTRIETALAFYPQTVPTKPALPETQQ